MAKNEHVWFAVVNPQAGSGKTLSQWRKAESLLYSHNVKYQACTPESSVDANQKILEACKYGFRHFLAVGGDGTVHNTLRCIVDFVYSEQSRQMNTRLEDFTLAVLPIGSGNDWLRSHNIPKKLEEVIELIARESFAPQDVVKVSLYEAGNGMVSAVTYMANVGGYSFDANVCDLVNARKSKGQTGKIMYIQALKDITFKQKLNHTRLCCDDAVVFDEGLYTISIGNGRYSGGGLCQTPSAVMDDGKMDIMVAPKFALWRVFFNIHKLLAAKTESIRFLRFFKAKSLDIIPKGQGQLVEVDGEIIGRAPARFEVLDQRINVLHQNK